MSVVLDKLIHLSEDGLLIRIQLDFKLLGWIRNSFNFFFFKPGRGPKGANVVQQQ